MFYEKIVLFVLYPLSYFMETWKFYDWVARSVIKDYENPETS